MSDTLVYFTDSAEFGGAEHALLHHLTWLDRQRWRPVLLHHGDPGLAPLLDRAHELGVAQQVVTRMPLGWKGARLAPVFARTLAELRPALFHAHLSWPLACKYALAGAVLARVPHVMATVQLFLDEPYSWAARIQQRLLTTGIDRYVAVSQATADAMHAVFRVPTDKLAVIHNGVPVERYQCASDPALRRALAGPGDAPVVLTVARLDRQKGHMFLLEAAQSLPNVRFALAGEGQARAALEDRARALGVEDRVLFLGARDDIPQLLACCDLFVLPSLYEGLPLSILEAMAAGRPVVASAIPGVDEAVVHNETGLLAPPGNAVALARAMDRLLTDAALRQRLVRAARLRVHNEFSAESMVRRVMHLYEELCMQPETTYAVA